MKTCFVCSKVLLPSESSHVLSCARASHLEFDDDEIKFKQLQHQISHIKLNRDWVHELYTVHNYATSDFKREFSILSKQLLFLLDYFNIPKRTKEKSEELRRDKQSKSVFEKYGVKSTNSLPHVKAAKQVASMKKYGVDNVAKSPEVNRKGIKTKLERYGTASFAFLNKSQQEVREIMQHAWRGSQKWRENLSIEDKSRISSILSVKRKAWYSGLSDEQKLALLQKRRSFKSKLEDRVYDAIKSMDVPIKRQHWIDRLSYDFKIGHNIILEINGDYWHANPILYEHNDVIPFPNNGLRVAEDIWEKDRLKKEKAESYGYKVFYLWESELNDMADDEIRKFVDTLISEQSKPLNPMNVT